VFAPEGLYREPNRPPIRFSVKSGWNNDPNGLICLNGVYHLFYQYNPCSTRWGNIHWGHAVSTDLIHWEEGDIALYPDEWGPNYSGCAVLDERNVSGLGFSGRPPLLLFYTAGGGSNEMSRGVSPTQRIAYSLDGGKTFLSYPQTAVDTITGENRDPKVVWCEDLSRYLMALYLEGEEYALLTSDDLLHWEQFQRISIRGDWECPNPARLRVRGTDRFLWILFGARSYWLAGEFRDGRWVTLQEESIPFEKTRTYAGQLFSGTGERAVEMDWFCPSVPLDPRFSQMISLPRELTLEQEGDRYWLCRNPVAELSAIRRNERTVCLAGTECRVPAAEAGLDLELTFPKLPRGKIAVRAFGQSVTFDPEANTVSGGKGISPMTSGREPYSVRILMDPSGTEVFPDGGRFVFAGSEQPDPGERELSLRAENPMDGATLKLADLLSVRNTKNL
ncbi:MAG: glycoside hydrolase family 32 protein, partial [Candidatus Methanomethylophilaceae archaeon]|nr:glycoside hydrolase family 32 protein [Candidatus Methanomethylophilaceae archaeon]